MAGGRWIDGLHRDMPAVVAARRVLDLRLQGVEQLLTGGSDAPDDEITRVHALRVATRRAGAALRLFREWCRPQGLRRVRRQLRRIRRSAAEARCCDVQLIRLRAELPRSRGTARLATQGLIDFVQKQRDAAGESLQAARRSDGANRLPRARRRLLASLRAHSGPAGDVTPFTPDKQPYTLVELAARELPGLAEEVGGARGADLKRLEAVHRLRIAGKRLRYAIELTAARFGPELRDVHYPRVEALQERLGAINDVHELLERVETLRGCSPAAPGRVTPALGRTKPDADALSRTRPHADAVVPAAAPAGGGRATQAALGTRARALRTERDRLQRDFLHWWQSPTTRARFAALSAALACEGSPHAAVPDRLVPRRLSGNGPRSTLPEHRRFAAIDVGTNSMRMVIAETDLTAPFRVIDDLKEPTRLGAGLYTRGALTDEAMAASLAALERMEAVAQRYRVERLRAVGTSALREARNAGEFLDAVEQRTGLRIEVIDADHEARLAFSSVAGAFDLGDRRVATMDLGGGSMQLVLSSDGVIEAIYKLPLGAVRLTETYARDDEPGMYRFSAMRRAVDRSIAEALPEPLPPPELLIGTGGTFTNLARLSLRRGGHDGEDGRFPFALRGYELPREEVGEIVDWLRRLPLAERRRTAELSSQRAEIIVAGVCVVERVMRRLGVQRVRVHDGGIRDGLLSEMIDEIGLPAARPRSSGPAMLTVARAFARRSEAERPHSEHVAKLALRIFDRIVEQAPGAAGTWGDAPARDLLHAGALLHDVGMQVGWRRHHRHGHAMILHADLPGLSRRQIEILAALARYHRRRGPKASHSALRRLGDDDRRLLMHLAGILRIADGLDRLHTQNVQDVIVRVEPESAEFEVVAADDPSINIRYAARKADVFESAFRAAVRIVPATTRAKVAPPAAGRPPLRLRQVRA